ncbi:beta-1,4-galactosyltransferase 7-like [Parasteatoda tepidariorum]|uniref:beta-1,4-galactosyltransferase 7-like n=1 Tax=Parasteatoda tepidariorum TaxID=114398 RepID=UPI00077FDBC4|nr:beta-1,4-galactosyltransferase 7-like [Parasteatoda tepidariorum]
MRSAKKIIIGLLLLLACSITLSVFLIMSSLTSNCSSNIYSKVDFGQKSWSEHRLAVIVPFRDRFDELLRFAPHIHEFLNKQKIPHYIHVINQVDKLRFNRASLINVGYLLARQNCDYIAMHDVDLLPLNPKLSYKYPRNGPFHVAAPELHPKYHYSTFVGGILLLSNEQFELVNGLSNRYWGWGLEDDEFFARMREAKLNISRPQNVNSGIHNTFKHIHDPSARRRDTARLYNQKESTRKRDRVTGLSNVQYQLIQTHQLMIDQAPVIMHNVKLICNRTLTPWCEPKGASLKKL